MRRLSWNHIALVCGCVVAAVPASGCDQKSSEGSASGGGVASASSSVVAVVTRPSAPAPASAPRTAPSALPGKGAAKHAWLVVSDRGTEMGVIELRAGKAPVTTIFPSHPDGKPLTDLMTSIGGPKGLPLDMHIPTPGEPGMGENSTVMMKYGDSGYIDAVEEALKRKKYSVSRVARLTATVPEKFKKVIIERSGKPVGSIDFGTKPAKLQVAGDGADSGLLTSYWASVSKQAQLTVRFVDSKDGASELRTVSAKPTEAGYPRTAVLELITKHYYDTKHGYRLQFE